MENLNGFMLFYMSDKLVIFFYGYHCIAILLTLETVSQIFLFWQTALQGFFPKIFNELIVIVIIACCISMCSEQVDLAFYVYIYT